MSDKKKSATENIKYIDIGTGDFPIIDEVAANCVAANLSNIFDELKAAAEHISETGADLKNLKKLLSENETVVEVFFQVNMILKGFLVVIEGEEWERCKRTAKHNYPPGVIEFLQEVHNGTWNVKPKPPKIVNIE